MMALTTSWLRATEVLETYIFNVSLRVKCRLQKLFSTKLGICVDISGSTFSGYRKVGSLVKQIFFPMHLHLKVSRRFLSPGFSFLFLSWENHLKLSPSHCISVSECQKIGHVFSQLVSYCIRQCCATLLNWILIVFTALVLPILWTFGDVTLQVLSSATWRPKFSVSVLKFNLYNKL